MRNINENIDIIHKVLKKDAILTITAPSDNHACNRKALQAL